MPVKRITKFWSGSGLIARLMLAVGIAIVGGGGVQTALLVLEGAAEHSARLKRELNESLAFMAPLVADQALVDEYAAVQQLLNNQVKKGGMDRYEWTDRGGRPTVAQDVPDKLEAPIWFTKFVPIESFEDSTDVVSGGVSYGKLYAKMTPVRSHNRLWQQFVKQLQIVAATLLLLLQLIWLIFRGNLGTLRMLAESANRFSQGDRSVRIKAEGAAEVRIAAEAFNNMANNTERLLESLGKSESKNRLLATIVEQSSEAIWTMDLLGVVTSWNAGAANMFGYDSTEAIGHLLTISQSSVEENANRMKRLVAGERFSYDTKATTKNGTTIDIQVAVAPLVNEANECVGTIAVARDVTQSKRSEEALMLAREAAVSANHAKSSFLARMSHEIRTPMNGVLGMTELLLETGLTKAQRKYAETVQSSGKNLLAIINDVLDFSKIEAGKLELEHLDMDVRKVVEDIVDLLAERASAKGLELACRLPSTLRTKVKGDPLRLGQVLTNLVGNAIKFTQQGAVVIGVECINETDADITIRFEVTDSGAGIHKDAQKRIFEEFSQADGSTTRKYGGSGLGLAISSQLVEMMGGAIELESTVGVGSTFWFKCKFEKQVVNMRADSSVQPSGALTGLRALIIESTSINRGILHSQVDGWGMDTHVAETPERALETLTQAAAAGAPYDLAIIDLGSAGSECMTLAKAIRAVTQTRLALLSPVGHPGLTPELQSAGIDASLVKPIRQSDLYECLVNMMARRLSAGERAASLSASAEDRAAPPPTGQRVHVLLVEDNAINQAVAIGLLRKIGGYDVTVANNGLEALDAHARHSFDLILMDCHMPEMDGFAATNEIRKLELAQQRARVPVIALTANAMAQDRQDCLDAGMDDHLSKPFSRVQLQDMLTSWLQKSARSPSDDSAAANAAVLDRSVLDELRELQSDADPHLLAHVLDLYLSDSQKLVDKLNGALAADDIAGLERTLHTFKSTSGNVGATRLSQLCGEFHTSIRSGDTEDLERRVGAIVAEHNLVQAALAAEKAKPGTAHSAERDKASVTSV